MATIKLIKKIVKIEGFINNIRYIYYSIVYKNNTIKYR